MFNGSTEPSAPKTAMKWQSLTKVFLAVHKVLVENQMLEYKQIIEPIPISLTNVKACQ